jgi:5-methylcytosine-specific restriction protein A
VQRIDAYDYLKGLLGRSLVTPGRGHSNTIVSIQKTDITVATERSPNGEPVSVRKIQAGLDLLVKTGAVRIQPETFGGYRRSSFIGAVLASLPGTEVVGPPTTVRLTEATPLRDRLADACDLVTAKHKEDHVNAGDPLYQLMVHSLPAALRDALATSGYKIRGSAGQYNFLWAETPWVGVFDRLVTESAQRGHYIVFLIHPKGSAVFLSLNQGVTETRAAGGKNYLERLVARGAQLRSHLAGNDLSGLISGPIDLGGKGPRTQGYAAGNVVALPLLADELPHDAVLAAHLARFTRLYEAATVGDDETRPIDPLIDTTGGKKSQTENRRLRWHLRAEGRNRAAAKKAKELGEYSCEVCQRRPVDELGEIGKRCVDAHHLTPFSELDSRPRNLDPKADFAVVCANCHRLLHSETPPLRPAKLADLLRERGALRP